MADLVRRYQDLIAKYKFDNLIDAPQILSVIRDAISSFMQQHHNVAIYCNGYHTQMLMADFIFELKDVRIIIDNYKDTGETNGFCVIHADQMETYHIDGVIISSFDYMESIIEKMKRETPAIPYLNIYQKIREAGIDLQNAYYENAHPYQYYKCINGLQRAIRKEIGNREEQYYQLIGQYIRIKDFRTAIIKTKEWGKNPELLADLEELYHEEILAAKGLSKDHVLMLCIDGMQGRALAQDQMPKMYRCMEERGRIYTRAYSYSTSTYESLLPVFSENLDMTTEHYNQNCIPGKECRFVQVAKQQGRDLFFYTDMAEFVKEPAIRRSNRFQTATEKMWDFLIDAQQCRNGLFYIHVLYESHYSFVNPYTKEDIIAEGTSMLFDYLDAKGGALRADYKRQHQDSIRYLDDVLTPIIEELACPAVIYADHGNVMLTEGTRLEEVSPQLLTCHEDLIRIPFAIMGENIGVGVDNDLISLMELNSVIISLMKKNEYRNPQKNWVKIGRSAIYNPDFHFLYSKMNEEYRLQAFEGFIFQSGEKLVVYAGGRKELYSTDDDREIFDGRRVEELFFEVKAEVTVC